MDVCEYMKKHSLTDEALDALAAPYESGDFPSSEGRVYVGSHLDSAGKQCVTAARDVDVSHPSDSGTH